MLFDLKGRRKNVIKVTYLILAILFGGGLVLFGVGSNQVQGGLVDALTGNGGGGSDTGAFEDQVATAQRATRARPKDERAWLALSRAQYNLAASGDDYDRTTGQFEEGAAPDLEKAAQAWERYVRLDPKKPDSGTATLMVQAYSVLIRFGPETSALDRFEQAARTQRIVAETRPSPIAYYQLAAIYYAIGKIAPGDRASDEALELTPKDQRNTVRAQLEDARKQGVQTKKQLKKAEAQAAEAAKEARKQGKDPFGTQPGQSPLAPQAPAP
jgi:tetratricopeptide (TPR) repeat protein